MGLGNYEVKFNPDHTWNRYSVYLHLKERTFLIYACNDIKDAEIFIKNMNKKYV